ncbi:hypothetical protein ACFLQL_00080 [Verrucomicrobiota bacterium]
MMKKLILISLILGLAGFGSAQIAVDTKTTAGDRVINTNESFSFGTNTTQTIPNLVTENMNFAGEVRTNWPTGGEAVTNWAGYPANTNLDMGTNAIILGGEARTNWPIGEDAVTNWSYYPANSNVNLGTNAIIFGGETRTNWPTGEGVVSNWSHYPANSNVNFGTNTIILNGEPINNWPSTNLFPLAAGDNITFRYEGGTTYIDSVASGTAIEGTYPVFQLALGGRWTDFELKGTTNNFDSLVYFYQSSVTNALADDTNVLVYFTDDCAADVRKWIKQDPIHSNIYYQLTLPSTSMVDYIYVFPSHDLTNDWERWMYRTNENLIWSYVRFDGVEYETNYYNEGQHWNAAYPFTWNVERTVIPTP